MQCSDFFQPYLDWLWVLPTDPQTVNYVEFLIAGNRSESNRFVLYMAGSFNDATYAAPYVLGGAAFQYFSDRVSYPPGGQPQPFDANNTTEVSVTLTVPNGPLVFSGLNGGPLIAQFSTIECRDNGLLVCTSDFDRTILVMSLSTGVTGS